MAALNSLQMNNPLSAKIRHLDCPFRSTVPYNIVIECAVINGLGPALSTLFVPILLKSKLDHAVSFLVTENTMKCVLHR